MPQFYARYVPPKIPESSGSKGTKRKRTNEDTYEHDSEKLKDKNTSKIEDVLDKYSSSKVAQKHNESVVVRQKKERKQSEAGHTETEQNQDTNNSSKKHEGVFSKFKTSSEASRTVLESNSKEENSTQLGPQILEAEKHGLESIIQPVVVSKPTPNASFSSRPEWISQPLRASQKSSHSFHSLGLDEVLVNQLKSQGQEVALPIQGAVLPLLLTSSNNRRSDICVAAATGSGKTLSYVLPILQSLQHQQTRRLRAVIVAPTRTLVRQVAQVCQSLLSKSSIRIASAEGSKPLQEEQRLLVETTKVYDMLEYRKQKQAAIDWSRFSLKRIIEQAETSNYLDSIGYVTKHCSKVDVLVTTPGRLVDHLQSTEGFNLDYVNWFVVDEADRLLNESFQDWLEVVIPALRSHRATERRDLLMAYRRIPIPARRVTKVLLSATMTEDLSKLMALELQDPKLVVIDEESLQELNISIDLPENTEGKRLPEQQKFQIPNSMIETAIPLKANDSGEKPLFLLQLLQHHIFDKPISKKLVDRETSDGTAYESYSSSLDESESESDASDSGLSSPTSKASIEDQPLKKENGLYFTDNTSASFEHQSRKPRALVFVRSTEAAGRLARLLSLLQPDLEGQISIYTSGANARSSAQKVLASFRAGRITVLISTDLAGRGLNIENLEHVVNYDVPNNALTYVHRVGRTARAGKTGRAWTLVEHRQGKWFWEVIGEKGAKEPKIGRQQEIKKLNLTLDDEDLKSRYQAALEQLGAKVKGK